MKNTKQTRHPLLNGMGHPQIAKRGHRPTGRLNQGFSRFPGCNTSTSGGPIPAEHQHELLVLCCYPGMQLEAGNFA